VAVALGLGSRKVADALESLLDDEAVPSRPVTFTPARTASPPSKPMATETPTRARSPVRTGRFSVSMR
jgi:hypothetical protein